jgi:hypothetical protein
VELPIRLTGDVDVGVNRRELGLTSRERRLTPLLEANGFKGGYEGEDFRFSKQLGPGRDTFVVDVMVAPGASRLNPPIVERGVSSMAAPGLAYALVRGPTEMQIRFPSDVFGLPVVTLDAAFVMKAALVQSGYRTRPDLRVTDTADAAMLAAACAADKDAVEALREHRARSDVKAAFRCLEKLARARSAEARRVEEHLAGSGIEGGAEWAAAAAQKLVEAVHGPTA